MHALESPQSEPQEQSGNGAAPVIDHGLHGNKTAAALLSPFLVPRLQLLSGVPQKDVVLFLGVVVLMALGDQDSFLFLFFFKVKR